MENSAELSLRLETQEHSDSRTSQLIREWLFRFGVEHKEDIAPRLPLWLEQLGGIDPQTLQDLFERAMRTCKFFPKIAEILEPLDSSERANYEDEWQALLDYCKQWVHPDIAFSRAPELPPEIDHAARAAGGVYFLRECSQDELGWRKKAFLEDLERQRKTEGFPQLPSELRKLIAEAGCPKLLPKPAAIAPEERPRIADRLAEAARQVIETYATPVREAPRVVDIEGRRAELRRQAELIRQKYPRGA